MTTDNYRYVDGEPTKYPFWGTELAFREMKTKKVIWITSSYFSVSLEHSTGMLTGIRSKWVIDDDLMTAQIIDIRIWQASDERWDDQPSGKVSAGHRAVLASFLMGRWSKGKLRGRINDTL